MKFIFCFLLLLHYYSCFWIYIGNVEKDNKQGWLQNMPQNSYLKIYLCSLDIFDTFFMRNPSQSPTYLEKGFISTLYLLNFMLFCFNIAKFIKILKHLNVDDDQKEKKMALMSQYLVKKKIKGITKIKIEKYFSSSYKNTENKTDDNAIEEMLNELPQKLKTNLFEKMNKEIRIKIPSFAIFSDFFLFRITNQLEEKKLNAKEILYQEASDAILIICVQGEVELNLDFLNFSKTFKQGDTFGELGFYINNPFQFSLTAKKSTSLLTLRKCDFLRIIVDFPEDYEKFRFMVDQITLYNHKTCGICQILESTSDICVHHHIKVSKEKIIQKINHSPAQKRVHYKRNPRKKATFIRINKENFPNKKEDKSVNDECSSLIILSNYHDGSIYLEKENEFYYIPSENESSYEMIKKLREKSNKSSFEQSESSIKSTLGKKYSFLEKNKEDFSLNVQKDQVDKKSISSEDESEITSMNLPLKNENKDDFGEKIEIDQMFEFRFYFTNGNESQVIKQLAKEKGIKKPTIRIEKTSIDVLNDSKKNTKTSSAGYKKGRFFWILKSLKQFFNKSL